MRLGYIASDTFGLVFILQSVRSCWNGNQRCRQVVDNNPERKQDKVTVAILIGIAIYIVSMPIVYCLFPTVFGEHMPTALAATLALIDNLTHSPYLTANRAMAQVIPAYLLATAYVTELAMWLGFFDLMSRLGNYIIRRI
jgi:hypothetical protein